MATGYVDRSKLTAIADSIRSKKGSSDLMTLDQMPAEIEGIDAGDNNAKVDWSRLKEKSSLATSLTCITKLDLSDIDSSKTTGFKYFFQYYGGSELDTVKMNMMSATDTSNMFDNCSYIKKLDLSSWDTAKIATAINMFSACARLEEIILPPNAFPNIDSSSYLNSMFRGCSSLKSLNSENMCSQKLKNGVQMFSGCRVLPYLDLSNINTSAVTSMKEMFAYCYALSSINLSTWNTSKCKNMDLMFRDDNSLEELDLSNFDTSATTSMVSMLASDNGFIPHIKWGDSWASNASLKDLNMSKTCFNSARLAEFAEKIATRENSPVLQLNLLSCYKSSEIQPFLNKGWTVTGNTLPSIEDPSEGNVGDIASINGVRSICVYVADSPQSWGSRIYAAYYNLASVGYILNTSAGQYNWGPITSTGVTEMAIGFGLSNTNKIIAKNLTIDNKILVWGGIVNFRKVHGDGWFIPTILEAQLCSNNVGNIWTSTESSDTYAMAFNTATQTGSGLRKNTVAYVCPFIYV